MINRFIKAELVMTLYYIGPLSRVGLINLRQFNLHHHATKILDILEIVLDFVKKVPKVEEKRAKLEKDLLC